MISVPGGPKEFIAKSKNENVFDHLLAKVMIDAEQFLFFPVRGQRFLKLPGAREILAKWFLDLLQEAD